jgi:hypothetical protein
MLNKAVFLALLLCAVSPAQAGPMADKAVEIEGLVDTNNDAALIEAADALYGMAWDATIAIGIHQAVLVNEAGSGVGLYNPRPDEKYKVGAPIFIYAEPFGYGFGEAGEGLYSIGFTVDLKVMTEAGEVLGELPAVTTIDQAYRRKNREFQANITYTLTGVPAGRYVLETTLRDKNSGKVGTFQNTVEFVE